MTLSTVLGPPVPAWPPALAAAATALLIEAVEVAPGEAEP